MNEKKERKNEWENELDNYVILNREFLYGCGEIDDQTSKHSFNIHIELVEMHRTKSKNIKMFNKKRNR